MANSPAVDSTISKFNPYLDSISDSALKIYIKNRVLDQIKWYGDKSECYSAKYKKWTVASITLSALIPILTLLSDMPFSIAIKILITTLSSCTTIISSYLALQKFQELWVRYRSNCEILKSIMHRFFTKSGEFQNLLEEDAKELLVRSCEEYMTKEFQTWAASYAPKKDNQSSSTNS